MEWRHGSCTSCFLLCFCAGSLQDTMCCSLAILALHGYAWLDSPEQKHADQSCAPLVHEFVVKQSPLQIPWVQHSQHEMTTSELQNACLKPLTPSRPVDND